MQKDYMNLLKQRMQLAKQHYLIRLIMSINVDMQQLSELISLMVNVVLRKYLFAFPAADQIFYIIPMFCYFSKLIWIR